MDAQLESQLGPQVRQLARQYADGRFNKQEYRQRRRELIVRCSGEAPIQRPPVNDDDEIFLPLLQRINPAVRLAAALTMVGLVMLGAWSYLS